MPWSIAAAIVASAAEEEFKKKCAGLPKEEADKLRKERHDAIFKKYEENKAKKKAERKIIDDMPPKISRWAMVKYYTAKLALLFFCWKGMALLLLVVFVAFIASAQHETISEPENGELIYEAIK